ncbi:discoidin, CUB and LCCL domain-containing protein 2-like isoform X1 [Montipora foliosa]|uniref:discoidin, CUB and LCCL domain-containing protein 2-like isoform X1 n=2 Tax=Montipora foliosa TaxID=591990 RepID=UPI0035F1174F
MWSLRCSLWVFLLSIAVQSSLGVSSSNKCHSALGLENKTIVRDWQLTARSYYQSLFIGNGKTLDMEPKCARLNNNCAWCAPRGNAQYLQVDLVQDRIISGIATQGFEGSSLDYYVKKYEVRYSRDGQTWRIGQVMRGNHDGKSVVTRTFTPAIFARYIRIYPLNYNYRICMRMELYGCSNSSTVLSTTHSPSPSTSKDFKPTTRGTTSNTKNAITDLPRTTVIALSVPISSDIALHQIGQLNYAAELCHHRNFDWLQATVFTCAPVHSTTFPITTPKVSETTASARHIANATAAVINVAAQVDLDDSNTRLYSTRNIVLVIVGVGVVVCFMLLLLFYLRRRKQCRYSSTEVKEQLL